jgi:hypothetical protein
MYTLISSACAKYLKEKKALKVKTLCVYYNSETQSSVTIENKCNNELANVTKDINVVSISTNVADKFIIFTISYTEK